MQGALDDFTRVVEIQSEHPGTYYNRGAARLLTKDYGGGISDFTDVTEIDKSL